MSEAHHVVGLFNWVEAHAPILPLRSPGRLTVGRSAEASGPSDGHGHERWIAGFRYL